MCKNCGVGNDVLKARRLKLATYTAVHKSWCATKRGHVCDCDPTIKPMLQLPMFGDSNLY